MSTSDPKASPQAAAPGVGQGWPDLQLIAALANELFKGTDHSLVPASAALPDLPVNNGDLVVPATGPTLGTHAAYGRDPHAALTGVPEVGSGLAYGRDPYASTPALPLGAAAQTLRSGDSAWPNLAPPGGLGGLPLTAAEPSGFSVPGLLDPGFAAPMAGQRAGSSDWAYRPELSAAPEQSVRQFDAAALRREFPILQQHVNGRPLIWLDNAATTQKPQRVIDRLTQFYSFENSNIHRGAHTLAARATDAYEDARDKVRGFLNASSSEEIVFTRGATEAINLVAQSWGRRYLREGDEIVITWLEHHSNIVPWQMLCQQTGARLRVAPVDDTGQILLDEYERLFNSNTRLASITHVSNALGTILPVADMVQIARRFGARVLVDGAQAVSHLRVDVQALDCDFYVFSGHKVFGPTGIGALYGKANVLDSMPPWQGGGNMIADVTFDKTVYHKAPMRFEAGTGNIADAVGLGAAIDYLERVGLENVSRHEHELLLYGSERLREIPKLRLIGTAREKAGVLSFVIDGIPSEQIGAALAQEGIAVRAGHHCAQPALRRYGLESTVRPSLALYNTREDLDALAAVLAQLQTRNF